MHGSRISLQAFFINLISIKSVYLQLVGSISAISFSRVPPDPYDPAEFKDSDFVVATRAGLVIHVQPSSWEDPNAEMRRGRVLLQFHDGSVFGIATHPSKSLFVTTGHTGLLQLWDYETQMLMATRRFDKLMGHRVAFSPDGEHIGMFLLHHILFTPNFKIAIGFTNGTVRLVYAEDFKDVPQSTYRQSRDCITEIIFSHDGQYFATSDADR